MKKEIHPAYHQNALIECVCGNKFTLGSVREHTLVEICSACHPFYTGEKKLVDTAGRVERFRARRVKAGLAPKKTKKARDKKTGTI